MGNEVITTGRRGNASGIGARIPEGARSHKWKPRRRDHSAAAIVTWSGSPKLAHAGSRLDPRRRTSGIGAGVQPRRLPRLSGCSALSARRRYPGLVCITVAYGLMSLDVQTRLFEYALVRLEGQDIAGRVLEIALRADRTVRLDLYPSTVA